MRRSDNQLSAPRGSCGAFVLACCDQRGANEGTREASDLSCVMTDCKGVGWALGSIETRSPRQALPDCVRQILGQRQTCQSAPAAPGR